MKIHPSWVSFLKEVLNKDKQLEILKRDKLDYVFQSLSVITILPLLCLEPIKSWAVSEFNFTKRYESDILNHN